MEIVRYYKHKGHIDDLSTRYRHFSKLKHAKVDAPHLEWRDKYDGSISHHALAVFVGKTGYGKSSTVNYFFGEQIMKTSDVEACTRECQSLDFELSPNCYFTLGDLPGIGESEYRDKQYLKVYKDFLCSSSVVVFVIRADMRDYSIDESAYKKLFRNNASKKKVVFALNYCDKIEPINRRLSTIPTSAQIKNIDKKKQLVKKLFKPVNSIIPYSAETGWNMDNLANEIVKVITNSGELKI